MAEWKPIPSAPGYEVSDDGRVRSLGGPRKFGSQTRIAPPCERILQPHSAGYLQLVIRGRNYFVHRLVAEAFVPKILGRTDVNHKNGDKHDNRAGNLEWATRQQNIRHSVDVLGNGVRDRHASARLTPGDVLSIRSDPRLHREIAAEYGVSRATVGDIKSGRRWSTLPG